MGELTGPTTSVDELAGDELVGDCSAVELMWEAKDRAHRRLVLTDDPEAKREFAVAKTLLEDAINRFNRGVYKAAGRFAVGDAERTLS